MDDFKEQKVVDLVEFQKLCTLGCHRKSLNGSLWDECCFFFFQIVVPGVIVYLTSLIWELSGSAVEIHFSFDCCVANATLIYVVALSPLHPFMSEMACGVCSTVPTEEPYRTW